MEWEGKSGKESRGKERKEENREKTKSTESGRKEVVCRRGGKERTWT